MVRALCAELHGLGVSTLRFNFRRDRRDSAELLMQNVEDAQAALAHLAALHSGCHITLVGYSWGACVAAHIVGDSSMSRVDALALVSPALTMFRKEMRAALQGWSGPVLLCSGDTDEYCKAEELLALSRSTAMLPSTTYKIVRDADHFWGDERARADGMSIIREWHMSVRPAPASTACYHEDEEGDIAMY